MVGVELDPPRVKPLAARLMLFNYAVVVYISLFKQAVCPCRSVAVYERAEEFEPFGRAALDLQQRKYYYETHTGQEWGSISSHEILLNASLLGIEGTVDILEGIYKR